MKIFNSLGSNYNFRFVVKSIFASNRKTKSQALIKYLEDHYSGKAILTYKGREAIELALNLVDQPGSKVAITGFTCFAVYTAIKNQKYSPVYLDIGQDSLNFSAETFSQAIKANPDITCVIIQNTLGSPCNIKEISRICQQNNIVLIEDLAHSIGTKYDNNQEAGSRGDFVFLSFSQDKMVDGISGGALIIRNPKYSQKNPKSMKRLSISKQSKDRVYPLLTFKIRLLYKIKLGKILHLVVKKINLLPKPVAGNLDGIIHHLPNWYCGLIKDSLKELSKNINHRRKIARIYASKLNTGLLIPAVIDDINKSTNMRFPILVKNREELIKYLSKMSIYISDTWYDAPIAPKRYLSKTDYSGQCPNSESIIQQLINLPTHINISEEEATILANIINDWTKQNG